MPGEKLIAKMFKDGKHVATVDWTALTPDEVKHEIEFQVAIGRNVIWSRRPAGYVEPEGGRVSL